MKCYSLPFSSYPVYEKDGEEVTFVYSQIGRNASVVQYESLKHAQADFFMYCYKLRNFDCMPVDHIPVYLGEYSESRGIPVYAQYTLRVGPKGGVWAEIA